MSKIGKKRINEVEYPVSKRIKTSHNKKEEIVDFDAINKLILSYK